jgi:hypothetical protein
MPARRFFRRVFKEIREDPHVALGVRFVKTDPRARIVFQRSEDRVNDFHIRGMAVHNQDFVEPVMNQGAADIVHHVLERFGPDGDRADPKPRRSHVMRAVPDPDFRDIEHFCLLTRTPGDLDDADRVGEEREMVGVLFQTGDRDHDDVFVLQIFLDIVISQVSHVECRKI